MAVLRIGILTSGGDCSGLNAAMRGAVKACYDRFGEKNTQIIGIKNGYYGLINGTAKEMKPSDFSGILTLGGTMLGTKRQSFKMLTSVGEDGVDKIKMMKNTYKDLKLDCLITLGGNGTHKTANLLSSEGLNIIGLPKTIDNDIYGTDVTFGFHTALETATGVIDRLHTTAASHSRVILAEIMGNKTGWLTLYSGIAGGADVIIIPECPYDIEKVIEAVEDRAAAGKKFSIIAVAEGAYDKDEAKLKRKDRSKLREEQGIKTATERIAYQIEASTGIESRVCVPGHMLRGGTPSAYDRYLSTAIGARAAKLIESAAFGYSVAVKNEIITENKLPDIAGISKPVPEDSQAVKTAKQIGISFGA
ncbi:MAG: ATP-dependent 6-phosphofructokinase [Ruminococcus sp.]|jgi:6-phosphofructokinase 1|nr:ATP-dependent 6-phosphofructokinase [Ruminococcus sp.]